VTRHPVPRAVVAWALLLAALGAGAAPVHYEISVSIDPVSRKLEGRSVIDLESPGAVTLGLSDRFRVRQVLADGQPLGKGRVSGGIRAWRVPGGAPKRRIEVAWQGTLAPLDTGLNHRQTLNRPEPVAGTEGTFLPDSSVWYPRIGDTLGHYRVALDLPAGQRGLVPGRLVQESESGKRYRATIEFPFPAEGIDLMAGPYRVQEHEFRGAGNRAIRLRTYFHPEIADLAPAYLESVADYLALYEKWIGEYPFTEFSVVSSPTPTGFGMPTLTYLGVTVLKLPFIRATSLGHEVLHNWWGNSVYPDFSRGNWSEGLTTFMADYAYKEREGPAAAREMRLSWLRDLTAVPPGQDRPLAEFTSRTHGTSQIVGYNKAAMMFFMLRELLGSDTFDRGLRGFYREHRFKIAGWPELRRAFENASRQNLGWFFDQWLNRPGTPAIRLVSASSAPSGSGYRIEITLAQETPPSRLRVPVLIRSEDGESMRTLELERQSQGFALEVPGKPLEVGLDPELAVLRRLAADEAPAILRQVMVDAGTVTVLLPGAGKAREAAQSLAERLQDHAPKLIGADADLPPAPVLVIGLESEVDAWLARRGMPPRPTPLDDKGTAQAWTASRTDGAALAIVSASNDAALSALERPLPHYGRQSYVVFEAGKVIERGTWPVKAQTVTFR